MTGGKGGTGNRKEYGDRRGAWEEEEHGWREG